MTGFRNTKVTLMHFTYLRMTNTLHEDMTTITRGLIGGFLQTRSVDVISRTSFSRKALGISKLRNL
jgi:hypothetical protein